MKFGSLFRVGFLVLFGTWMVSAAASAEELKHVVVVRPDTNHPFWESFEAATRAACKSLGCEIEDVKADWDQVAMVDRLETRLKREPKPDLVLFQSFKMNGPKVIALCEKYQVYGFLVNADLDARQIAAVGAPREHFKYWIGKMMPDDALGGKLMAELIYQQAVKKGLAKDGVVSMAAIQGNAADGASIERVKGLNAYLQQNDKLKLLQMVEGKWLTERSADLTKNLIRRYPQMQAMWAAGDTTAIGVINGAKAVGKTPGKDILTAGLDWSTDGLKAVKDGAMEVSVGGHFMEGAWAIVATYDYFHGHDFAKEDGVFLHSNLAVIDKDNVDHFLAQYGNNDFSSIDFSRYSKVKNPAVKRYNLDFSPALK